MQLIKSNVVRNLLIFLVFLVPPLHAQQFGMQAQATSIAIIDSGINPVPSLAGRIDQGIDLVDGALPAQDATSIKHGTKVAQIAASIDASNRVMPVRVLDGRGFTSAGRLIAGINFAASSNARVLNLSLADATRTYNPAIVASMMNAAASGKLLVMAAGNEGARAPSFPSNIARFLGGAGIAVGALDRSGDIANYSNRAGPTRQFYVLAPGYSRFSPHVGTSFAAPYVSGTAAAIYAQNPGLSAAQVSQIIFSTAIDMGAPGVDEIYGHGKLNRRAALAPQGQVSVPTASDGSVSGIKAAPLGGVSVGAGIGAAIHASKGKLGSTLVLDAYERPYVVNLGDMIEVRDDSLGLDDLVQSLKRRTEYSDLAITDNLSLGVWYGEDELQRFERETTGQRDSYEYDWSLSLQQGDQTGAYYALNMNLDPRQFFGAAEQVSPYAVFDRRSLTAPYAGFAANGNMALTGYRLDNGTDLRLGLISMDDATETTGSSQSMLMEASTRPLEKLKLGVQLSALSEQGSLFGSSANGALSVDHADTVAAGLLAGYELIPGLSLQMLYSQGYTRVDDSNNSLLNNFSGLRSDSYALGLQGRGLLAGDDSYGITLSRPLHVNSGRLNLSVPGDIDVYSREVSFDTETIDLGGVQRQTDLELGYHLPVGKETGFASYLRYRHDPAGVLEQDGNGRYGVMMSVTSRF